MRPRKMQENLRIIPLRKIMFLLMAALITGAALPGTVFACDVFSVTLYLGRTQAIAEAHNTSTVYRPSGNSFWFHVHWSAYTPDQQGFDLVIYDYTTSETLTTPTRSISSSTQRTYTGSTSLQTYSFVPHTIKAKVRRKSGAWFWSPSGRTLTVFKVDIDTPSSFPAYACKDNTLSLGSTVTHSSAGGGTYSWSKYSGPGTVTFGESTDEDPTFSADTTGTYTVKVEYTKNGGTVSDTSGTIRVIDGLTVFPREAYVCVGCTKDFYAYACVEGSATDVTSSATFSTNNPGGSMKRTTGESTGPNNNILHPGSVSASPTSDWVKASCGGDPTDAAHDCDLIVVKVEITDDAGNPITATQTVCVGQEISLKTKILPSGLTGSNWQWAVPGETVKDYSKETIAPGRTRAFVTELSPTDLQQSTIQFYWVDGADGRDISVSCQIDGEVSCADTVQFNVKRPALDEFGLGTGAVVVGNSWGSTQLSFGIPTLAGVAYGWKVTPPLAFGGKLKIVQLIEAHFERIYIDDSVENCENPDFWLDSQDPYADPKDAPAGVQTEIVESDSPALGLVPGFKEVEVIYALYDTYLMFEPVGSESIWVPLSKFEWNWEGRATSSDGGNSWIKSSGTGSADSASETTEFPEWPDTRTPTHPPWE